MRIYRKDLDGLFVRMVTMARAAGVNATDWSFGAHYGKALTIVRKDGGPRQRVSPDWYSNREAWNGMHAMIAALQLFPVVADV